MEEEADIGRLLIRAQIDELQSQIQHLSRSNEELQLALQETPDDEDFLLAVKENVVVMEKKQEAIKTKEEELYRLDVAFRQGEFIAALFDLSVLSDIALILITILFFLLFNPFL